MPTYDYECKSCGHNFEAFQSIMDPPLEKCPKCGKSVRRLIAGGTGVIFKGSGFYVTDNRRSSGKKAGATTTDAKSSKSEASSSAGSGTTSSGADGSGSKGDSGGAKTATTSTAKGD